MRNALVVPLVAIFLLSVLVPCPVSAQDLAQGIESISQKLTGSIDGQVKKMAIVEFPDLNGYQSSLGQFIADELVVYFLSHSKPGSLDIVERKQLAKVLREHELVDSSLFEDGKIIERVGKLLGVDAIVTGSITDLGSEVNINARVISVNTGRIFAAASVKVAKNEMVQQLMRQNAGAPQASSTISGSLPRRQIQRGDVFFLNDFLRVEVSSAAVSKKKNRVTFSLLFENISSQDVFLAVEARCALDECCIASSVDDLGTAVPSTQARTDQVSVTGLPCLWNGSNEQRDYARFNPASKVPVVMVFETEEIFEGDIFSVNAALLRFDAGSMSRFSVGISGIEVQKSQSESKAPR